MTPEFVCSRIEQLSEALREISRSMPRSFNIDRYDGLRDESSEISKRRFAGTERPDDQSRSSELGKQISQMEDRRPANADDLRSCMTRFHVRQISAWLQVKISNDFGNEFLKKIDGIRERLGRLEFNCCRLLNGDLEKEETIVLSFPFQRVSQRYYELVKELSSDSNDRPKREDMPAVLRIVEDDYLEEHGHIMIELREIANYLRAITPAIRSEFPPPEELIDPKVREWAEDINENLRLELKGYNTKHPSRKKLHSNVRQRRTDNPEKSRKAEELAQKLLSQKQAVESQR